NPIAPHMRTYSYIRNMTLIQYNPHTTMTNNLLAIDCNDIMRIVIPRHLMLKNFHRPWYRKRLLLNFHNGRNIFYRHFSILNIFTHWLFPSPALSTNSPLPRQYGDILEQMHVHLFLVLTELQYK